MNFIKTTLLALLILSVFVLRAQVPEGYYSSSEGLTGDLLKAALHGIIKDHVEFPYTSSSTDVWDILKKTDRDTANPDNVILLYSGWSVNAAQEYNNGNGWTREHVWAKSHGGFGTDLGAGTDVHHLRPCDNTVNSARNNKDFDNGGTLYIDSDGPTECYTDADSWEPRDAVKGDVARMLFYMAVRYEGENGEPDLELVDWVDTYDLNEPGKGYFGKLSTLLEWNMEDPVDSFEIKRNNVIFSYQKNRNPFIDHPEYVSGIWYLTGSGYIDNSKSIMIYPSPATDYMKIHIKSNYNCTVVLFTATGELVLSKVINNSSEIPVGQLTRGLYFIRVSEGNKTIYLNKISLN